MYSHCSSMCPNEPLILFPIQQFRPDAALLLVSSHPATSCRYVGYKPTSFNLKLDYAGKNLLRPDCSAESHDAESSCYRR
jgi:hypothetical protein